MFAVLAVSCMDEPILRDGGDEDDDPIVNPPPTTQNVPVGLDSLKIE